MNKCYSVNEEDYNMTEFSEVLDELECCGELEVGREYQEADAIPHSVPEFVHSNLDYMLESLDQNCFDDLGELWDNELTSVKFDNPSAYKELETFMIDWIEKNTRYSSFWKVKNSVTKLITQDDIDSVL